MVVIDFEVTLTLVVAAVVRFVAFSEVLLAEAVVAFSAATIGVVVVVVGGMVNSA